MSSSVKIIAALLAAVALLLAANIILSFNGRTQNAAMADIVSGKNYFTTHSPDGRIVYLWYYDYSGTAFDKNAYVSYLGQIEAGSGRFIKP